MNHLNDRSPLLKNLRKRKFPRRFAVILAGVFAAMVCAPADATFMGNAPIDITSMSVSKSDHIDGHSHTTTIATDADFSSIKWSVDGTVQETQTGPASESSFTFNYGGYGSTTGKSVRITAAASDANGFTASQTKTITVWSSSTSISIASMSANGADFAEDDTCTVSLQTDVGLWYVSWSVNGQYAVTTNGPALSTSFSPSLSGLGLPNGKQVTISATAYSVNANGVLGTATSSTTVTVWSNASSINIESFDIPDNVLIGNSITAQITTDIPFDHVDWYVDGVREEIDDPSPVCRTSSFTYTFNGDGGWKDGGQCVIKAVAFGVGEVANNWDEGIILLHEGEARWRSVEAKIVSIVLTGKTCVLSTRHGFEYYCTIPQGRRVSLVCEANWWTGRAIIAKMDASVNQTFDVGMEGTADYELQTYQETLEATATFQEGRYYSAQAKTILNGSWDFWNRTWTGPWANLKDDPHISSPTRYDSTPIRFFNGVTWE